MQKDNNECKDLVLDILNIKKELKETLGFSRSKISKV